MIVKSLQTDRRWIAKRDKWTGDSKEVVKKIVEKIVKRK